MADKVKEPSDTGKVRVLVYGTLKNGQTNHELMTKIRATFLGYDSVVGNFKLKDLGPFPAVFDRKPITAKLFPICGEVYMMDEDALAHLDFYEGHPHFFQRRKLWTKKLEKRVWVYFMTLRELDDPKQKSTIDGGLWHPSEAEENFWVNESILF